ncbi:MAG TPA: hypothetical protein PLP99_07380 [Ignavibacteriales bacterium]|nr:hypothetical protein [Ignavibacteriales bacterium]HOL81564.1 hypothetical protein [Ignavibacteriales bacterium]HOM65606.1 hypothetical protein [Ignavibacteriales bacterium]HPP33678.1 hypothetical protein [Ignavibacteriales bacterium]HRR18913.1 hypothetical protein [Ignavibacteriales bacterium]
MTKLKTHILIYYNGLLTFILGTLDPLEGSILILFGIFSITYFMFKTDNQHKKKFLTAGILATIGIFFMFYFSSLGGFLGNSKLSNWYLLLLIPYPVGWLLTIIYLIINLISKKK